jgi:hypothetical protein
MTTEQIIALAQAGGLILLSAALLTGQVWAKPSVDFLRAMLTESLSRETKLADALSANTATMQEAMKELRERKGGAR